VSNFGRTIDGYVKKYQARMRATYRTATQEIVADAQTPQGNDGRMPIDTGFLRASIAAAIDSVPSGQTKGEDGNYPSVDVIGGNVAATLLRWDMTKGQTIVIGWVAAYAPNMEYKYGFLRGATEQWPKTVDSVAKRVRRSI